VKKVSLSENNGFWNLDFGYVQSQPKNKHFGWCFYFPLFQEIENSVSKSKFTTWFTDTVYDFSTQKNLVSEALFFFS
jgi:hypothetical protein